MTVFDWHKNKYFLRNYMYVKVNQFCICICVWLVNKNWNIFSRFSGLEIHIYAQTSFKKKTYCVCGVVCIYIEKEYIISTTLQGTDKCSVSKALERVHLVYEYFNTKTDTPLVKFQYKKAISPFVFAFI